MGALLNSIYDLQQYGFDFVASPRHADLLMCTGPMTTHLLEAANATYEAIPHPKKVIAVGDCAIHGGVFKEAYATNGGVGEVLPVEVIIPGCPPSPQEILQVLLTLRQA
jgi:Ni,Fe-hydrogenase III small subunit